jgi:hypothetical protein
VYVRCFLRYVGLDPHKLIRPEWNQKLKKKAKLEVENYTEEELHRLHAASSEYHRFVWRCYRILRRRGYVTERIQQRGRVFSHGEIRVKVYAADRLGGVTISLARFTSVSLAVLCCSLASADQVKHYRRAPFHNNVYRGSTISLVLDGEKLTSPRQTASRKNDADPVAWRQWHHWNILKDMPVGTLPKGKHVLTIHILTQGNMNLAYFDFKERKPAAPGGAHEN